MMKIYLLKLLILFLVIFSLGSCNAPIFYMVTEEIPLLDPIIGGSPTSFVILGDAMYVASGKKIFKYSDSKWYKPALTPDIPDPKPVWNELDNFVMAIAATDNSLYALYLSTDNGKTNGKIRRYLDDSNYEDFDQYNFQSIYTSENVLFASVRNDDNKYSIYYLDENDSFQKIYGTDSIYILKSAAYGKSKTSGDTYYYLCAYSGIFCIEKNKLKSYSATDLPKVLAPGVNFNGILKLNDNYSVAISVKGDLYEITDGSIAKEPIVGFNNSHYSTGALATWRKSGEAPSLLLVGWYEDYYSTTSGYSNGYVEIELDTATGRIKGKPNTTGKIEYKFTEPGKSTPTSLRENDNYDRYKSSLGKKLINFFIQTPDTIDKDMIMFASTQQDGVWSYRIRDEGRWQWNAEK